jgi:uncharacterized protein (DUF58 family)
VPFDARFLNVLEALTLLARRTLTGDSRADRLTLRKGSSTEFADYRRYTPGDEIRYIDWNVYARHGHLFVKEFIAEENVHVSVLLDVSKSMDFGGKFVAAQELAAALGYIGLANYDSVSLFAFGEEVKPVLRFLKGRGKAVELLAGVEGLKPEGRTDLRRAFGQAIPRLKGRSLVVVISDFYDLEGYRAGLLGLLSQGFGIHLVHLVSKEERSPELRGRVSLLDLESGRVRELTVTERGAEAYRRRFDQFCAEIDEFARTHEIACARVAVEEPIERRVLEIFRGGGILEHR